MDFEGGVPRLWRDFQQTAGRRSAGGMYQNIVASQATVNPMFAERVFMIMLAIRFNHFASPPKSENGLLDFLRLVISLAPSDGHVCSGSTQRHGNGRADAFRAARDQGNFTFEFHGWIASPFSESVGETPNDATETVAPFVGLSPPATSGFCTVCFPEPI